MNLPPPRSDTPQILLELIRFIWGVSQLPGERLPPSISLSKFDIFATLKTTELRLLRELGGFLTRLKHSFNSLLLLKFISQKVKLIIYRTIKSKKG